MCLLLLSVYGGNEPNVLLFELSLAWGQFWLPLNGNAFEKHMLSDLRESLITKTGHAETRAVWTMFMTI